MKSIVFFLATCLFFISACTKKEESRTPKKTNILFIMADDHAYQAISAYSDHLIKTPNIDRIAKGGMLFSNACVTNSICAPSRATILTGKFNHLNGKIDNNLPFDTTQLTFPQLFQQAGYQTAMFGKLHFGNNPKGVDEFMILPGQGDYINPSFNTSRGDTTITGYATDIITDLTLDWLSKKRDTSKPFMMMYLHKAPHRPWWPRPDKMAEFSTKTFPEPATLFDDYKNRGTAAKSAEMNIFRHMMYTHDSKIRPETLASMGKVLPDMPMIKDGFTGPYNRANADQKALYDPIIDSINASFKARWPKMNDKEKMQWKYQRYMQDYLACISSVDDNVGRVLDYLDESGLAENTLVVYTSDQGFYLGEHGWFDKRFIYDESFKTPLLIRWPHMIKPGTTNDEMVQNLDFAQTFLEIAGIVAPKDMQGESLVPLLKGNDTAWTRDAVYYHYYEYPAVHMVKRHYGAVTKEYKLVHFYDDVDEWELYDRKKDPQEMNNVYADPAYADIVKNMTAKLADLRIKYKDSKELDQHFINIYKENGWYNRLNRK
ncbi:MAG: sulfatase [Saprospiraceae bacterium]|jgi:arylsulfatase A-like enzyme|nr:sulfatase [Saprospiraceae bacterium]MBK7608222.1 sulfatase [Saprospiraceae bacterium]MBL0113732.1 sulfatase [Saprospiraceae bacterium]MBP7803236.1 sulfatase [Saprospiraceae bacterium]MBP7923187.1 sulfatase [Saprospiraceae bacterium]